MNDPGILTIPLITEIITHSTQLPQAFHNEPADQLIVASSNIQNITSFNC